MLFIRTITIASFAGLFYSCSGNTSGASPMTGTFADTLSDQYSILYRTVSIQPASAGSKDVFTVLIHTVEKFTDSKDNRDKVTDRQWTARFDRGTSMLIAPDQLPVIMLADSGYIRIGEIKSYQKHAQ